MGAEKVDTAVATAEQQQDVPQKPKRAASAYWLFTASVREEITKELKEKNEGKANLGDIAKAVKVRWESLPEAEKKAFEDKAAADRERCAGEMKTFLEASDPAGTLRKKYQDLIPKKPVTTYFAFCQDAAMKEKASKALAAAGLPAEHKQLISKLAEMWKAVTAEEKAPFEEQHKKAHAEFLQKQKEWQTTPQFAEIEKAEKAQDERKKAQAAAEGAEEKEPEGKASGKKRGRSAAKDTPKKETPKKEGKAAAKETTPKAGKKAAPKETTPKAAAAPEAKKPRKSLKSEAPAGPTLDEKVLEEAVKLNLEGMLRNLAGRPEVVASGKTSQEILTALQKTEGLVNPAKRLLLGL